MTVNYFSEEDKVRQTVVFTGSVHTMELRVDSASFEEMKGRITGLTIAALQTAIDDIKKNGLTFQQFENWEEWIDNTKPTCPKCGTKPSELNRYTTAKFEDRNKPA